MQKIMFNDHYGLTKLVLSRKKDVTRRFVNFDLEIPAGRGKYNKVEADEIQNIGGKWMFSYGGKFYELPFEARPRFKVGEIVAVAQTYDFIVNNYSGFDYLKELEGKAGFKNKLNVKPNLMPHQIEITHIKVHRLQDMTDEDCIREGAIQEEGLFYFSNSNNAKLKDCKQLFDTPKKAFACLIDKMYKKGTWDSNPWVWAYSFKLIK